MADLYDKATWRRETELRQASNTLRTAVWGLRSAKRGFAAACRQGDPSQRGFWMGRIGVWKRRMRRAIAKAETTLGRQPR